MTARRVLRSSVYLVLFLILFLILETQKTSNKVPHGGSSLITALKLRGRAQISQHVHGLHRSAHRATPLAPCLKAKICCKLLNAMLTSSCSIILAGDVSKNPGPMSNPCGICSKGCRRNQKTIQCANCDPWFHAKCTGMPNSEYADLSARLETTWWCMACLFPYELSGQGLAITSDVQLDTNIDVRALEQLSDENLGPDNDHELMRLRRQNGKELLMAHLNINSFQNKFEEITNINRAIRAHIMFVSETKIDSSYPNAQFSSPVILCIAMTGRKVAVGFWL